MKTHAAATEPNPALDPIKIFNGGKAQELATRLGAGVDAGELQALLNDRGTVYRWQLWASAVGWPKHIREQLAAVAAAAADAIEALGHLDDQARRQLDAVLDERALDHSRGYQEHLGHLYRAASAARAATPIGAKPGLHELRELCGGLASVYEELSGRRFTYDVYRAVDRIHFLSASAAWVESAVAIIDPEVTPSNLDTVMRDLRKPHPKTA